ncbi:MAG TPA: T9SS type A sorting domain-containing protein, partial [Bacteroidia bacterium]|nr:T9SS type A sorting domain-containing protein [Bacteroidia bacterium]
TSTLQNPVHTYATEGNYTICLNLTDANNCSSSTCDTIVVVGLSQNLPGLVLEVAPNPFSGQTTVQYQLIESATITITVYDLQGAKVQVQSQGLQTPGQYRHAIGTGLAAGSYLLVFEADGKQLSRRIVKAQ